MSKKNEETPPPAPPAEEAPPPAAPAVAGPELLTPAEWAQRKSMLGKPDPMRPDEPPNKHWAYAAAEVLHGWAQDAHDYQLEEQKHRVSEADFDAALVAAGGYPAVPAHAPACGRNFKKRAEPVRDPHTKAVLATGKTVHAPKIQAVKTDG